MGDRVTLRPFFPFFGSKWNLARRYPPPAHGLVIEPFAGAAGYSTFHGVQRAVLIDVDPIIAGVWAYLIAATEREILALPELPAVGDSVDDHALPQEARWLIGFWLNRGSATPKRTRTAYSARADKAQLNWGPAAKLRIASQLELVRDWAVIEGPYDSWPVPQAATWFIDPPYVVKGRHYRARFDGHQELGEWAQRRPGQVIVCEGEGADWLPFAPLGSYKTSLGRAEEKVWLS